MYIMNRGEYIESDQQLSGREVVENSGANLRTSSYQEEENIRGT